MWAKVGKDEWRTRLVDDACIFLNRPGFEAGPGCALHVHAINKGVHFSKTKPTVCWQLPLHAEENEQDDGSTTIVLSEFGRDGWGEGGAGVRVVVHRGARGVHRARSASTSRWRPSCG